MDLRRSQETGQISRRSFLQATLAVTCASALAGCSQSSNRAPRSNAKQVNIYSWADYVAPDTIPKFEKRYGIRVVYDTFSSNESLLAKMQAGGTAYDIIVPTSYLVYQLKKLNLLAQIDHEKLPLLNNIMPRFRNPAYDRNLQHSVPYTWGTTGIGYDSRAFDPKSMPDDWDVFWDEKLSGRITLLDDARETIGMALKRRGHSLNTDDVPVIEAAAMELKAEKPLVMCYTSDQVIVQLAAGDSLVALGYSGDIYQASKGNSNIQYVIPKSGASLWLDNMCIPRGAPHPENAYKWINFMLEPDIAAANASYTRYASPNSKALELIGSDQRSDPNLYPPESLLSKCDELGDVGKLIFLYDRLWTEIKCS